MLLINPRLLGYTLLHAAAFIVFIASLASQLTTAELKSFESFTSSLSSLKSFTKVSSLASVDHCASNQKKLLYSVYIYIYTYVCFKVSSHLSSLHILNKGLDVVN